MTRADIPEHRYLPKRITPCPSCGDTDHVQVVIWGFPAFPPLDDEEDRVAFGGCELPIDGAMADWVCPTCGLGYTKKGRVVDRWDAQ